jgi:hypothetical protein
MSVGVRGVPRDGPPSFGRCPGGLLGCWSGGEDPGPVDPDEPAPEEGAQIERRGAALEPGVVVDRAAVAQLDPPSAAGGDLGDGALDVRSVLAVVLAQVRIGGPVRAGGAQQVVAFMQGQGAPGLRRGAAGA